MSDRQSYHDELARRRSARDRASQREGAPVEEEPVQFGWKDILAMTIAAYQVLLPVVLVFLGIFLLVWLLFRFVFH